MNARLEKDLEKYAGKAKYWRQGNFIVCTLSNKSKIMSVGVAKRNANDDPVIKERGEAIALSRAIRRTWADGE